VVSQLLSQPKSVGTADPTTLSELERALLTSNLSEAMLTPATGLEAAASSQVPPLIVAPFTGSRHRELQRLSHA
jgi:hypothetical protein